MRNLFLPAWYLRNGTINAAESQLEDASSSCERWGFCCGALVIVSVVAEFVIAHIKPPYDLFLRASAFTDMGLAIGIVGEVLLGMWNNRLQTELRKRSNEKLSAAIKDAGKANAQAAEANARAEEAALELVKFRAPRRLTREQISRIEETLKKFGDIRFSINLTGLDGEIGGIAATLANILTEIGWKLERWPFTLPGQIEAYIVLNRIVTVGGVAVNDIGVWYPLHIPDVMSAGQDLGMALTAEGIVATWAPALLDKPVVLIAIGPKT